MIPSRNQQGFTLIELAIAIMITGLIAAGGILLYDRAQDQQRLQTTYDHMDAITEALSIFVETSGRLPCPTDPTINNQTFGWEAGVTKNAAAAGTQTSLQVGAKGFPVGTCASANTGPYVGVVPFLSLNLDDTTARDGWGRYFTYAVSPQFARSNDQSHNADGTDLSVSTAKDFGKVHGRCRTVNWNNGISVTININAVKARFCCDDNDTTTADETGAFYNGTAFNSTNDIVIISAIDNATQISPQRDAVSGGVAPFVYDNLTWPVTRPSSGSVNGTVPTGSVPGVLTTAQSKILTPAFVLVSHGADGAGAYLANGSSPAAHYNMPTAGPELTNSNNPVGPLTGANHLTFADGPINTTPGNFYFDHIVRWMTQDGIMAAHGALSCQYP